MLRAHGRTLTVTVVVSLLAALWPLSATASAAPDKSETEQAEQQTTDYVPGRIATFNACNPCSQPPGINIAEYIAEYRPQVIGLQEICVYEVESIVDILESEYGLTYYHQNGSVLENFWRCRGTPWNPGNYGNALLSATPLSDRNHGEYPEGGSEDRGYVYATTPIHGVDTRVAVTHLAQGAAQKDVRTDQVWHLVNQLNPDPVDLPVVAVGDFNATPRESELLPMWYPFREADPGCAQDDTTNCKITFPSADKKFDYIWFERERVEPPGVVVTDTYSDHHAVYADLPG